MFTGIVESMGTLTRRRTAGPGAALVVTCGLQDLALGESVSVDGCCLTVARIRPDGFEADASAETLERTTLGALPVGARVNLERAAALGARMGGHLVTGHVDATCTLEGKAPLGDSTSMTFSLPHRLAHLVAEKGSITVSGVSLTVNAVHPGERTPSFDVVVIPHTREVTSLGALEAGGRANLEVDLVARYVARWLEATHAGGKDAAALAASDAAWLERLKRAGYLEP